MPKRRRPEDQRRRAARVDRDQPAAPDEGARQRPHAVLAARQLHGAPHRRLQRVRRPGPRSATSCASASASCSPTTSCRWRCCRSRPASIPQTCIPELEKCVKEYGNVGINLNPDPSGGHWTAPPLTDRHWYPIYEKMVEYDIPAMIHVSTSCNAVLPHHRRALPERRHHGLHAVPDPGRPVQGLPDAALPHPARRRRGALPLGALPRPGAGDEEAAADRAPAEQHLLRHLRLPPAGHRPAEHGDPGEERAVRLRDDRRRARHRSGDRPLLRRHQALHRGLEDPERAKTSTRSTKPIRAASSRGWTHA